MKRFFLGMLALICAMEVSAQTAEEMQASKARTEK